MESLQSTPARLILGVWSGCPAMVIIWCNLFFLRCHVHIIMGDTSMRSSVRDAFRRWHYPLNLERFAVAWKFGSPLFVWFSIIACVTNTCFTDILCLLTLRHCLINLEHMAFACSSDFPFADSYRLVADIPTHALRCSRSFINMYDFIKI